MTSGIDGPQYGRRPPRNESAGRGDQMARPWFRHLAARPVDAGWGAASAPVGLHPSLPRLPIHGLAQEVGVSVVTGVLLNHVAEDPTQAGRPPVG